MMPGHDRNPKSHHHPATGLASIDRDEPHDRECNGHCGWSSTYCESQWREFFHGKVSAS
ncbi:hypothetical protein HAMULUS_42 [Mycobacterium phage Hamulus]|uniref:Uncharacterized protein n=3 Tax=Cheoctovirus TaxID=1623281 RepID=R4JFS2_9CAUD|nr:hypothetical protein M040_gp42 [Mycobacterium phage SiSi]YP_008409106.1 hypothetical protein HAMULUS_42 [Mycobacterium phage Hamulus]YP_009636107.1 hypothetical protein FGG57_gp043 [Mycobacterium phage RockyHorror]AEK06751.1 hypothetical protein ROCKYHORROR_43 [Mycobacterium phage RockyHorror]AGK87878.1 hypothetical protein PBI_SISI_42 [Mycobacterium phage SiSi]AGT12451.1 hypothetical protein HAMULUS_42 [Mycobacterium phage Hamulus]